MLGSLGGVVLGVLWGRATPLEPHVSLAAVPSTVPATAEGVEVLADPFVPSTPLHHVTVDELLDVSQLPNLRFFTGFVTSLNLQRRVPNVVVEVRAVTSPTAAPLSSPAQLLEPGAFERDLEGSATADRKLCDFTPVHPAIPKPFRAALEDYRGSGYSRGHLAAAGNFARATQAAMCETFVLGANVVPQEGVNNADYWFRLETLARRDLTASFPQLYVLSGPLYLPHPVDDDPHKGLSRHRRRGPKQYVTHEVLGAGVAVPTHLFKTFAVRDKDTGAWAASSFVVPNAPVDGNSPLSAWQVSREALEAMAGFQLLPRHSHVAELCGSDKLFDCDAHFMTEAAYRTYWLGRQLSWSKNSDELERVWSTAHSSGVEVDAWAVQAYTKKKAELAALAKT